MHDVRTLPGVEIFRGCLLLVLRVSIDAVARKRDPIPRDWTGAIERTAIAFSG